jgi:hypothetical protein
MDNECTDIYSDIFLTLGLDPSQGGARFLSLLTLWVGVVGLTTFIVFQWSISNLDPATGKLSYSEAALPCSRHRALTMRNRPAAAPENFRLMKLDLATNKSKGIQESSRHKKQQLWIYPNGHLTFMTTRVNDDVTILLGGCLFQAKRLQGRFDTFMEATLL